MIIAEWEIPTRTTGPMAYGKGQAHWCRKVGDEMPRPLKVGWNPDLNIPAALESLPGDRVDDYVAVISTIDSNPEVSHLISLVPLLKRLGRWYAEVGDDVVVDIPTLRALIDEHDFFTGFDEVWLCSGIPPQGKPSDLKITSEVRLDPVPPALASWMEAASCCTGLGDGIGLNFATFDPLLAEAWGAGGASDPRV